MRISLRKFRGFGIAPPGTLGAWISEFGITFRGIREFAEN
jgi:hypothetical protein